MNQYREMIDRLPVPEGQAERLRTAVLAAETVFQNVDVTSVCGDVTLTVRQALGDEKTLYLLLDYQLPESTDVEMVRRSPGRTGRDRSAMWICTAGPWNGRILRA